MFIRNVTIKKAVLGSPPSFVWQDTLGNNDLSNWTENDSDNNGAFDGTNYSWNSPLGEASIYVQFHHRGISFGGDFEMELDFDLTSFTGTPSDDDRISMRLQEDTFSKDYAVVYIGIRGTGLGGWEYYLRDEYGAGYVSGPAASTGNHKV
ncbi:unnamed protein product, partial [marine sediment metagenome]